MLWLDLQKYWVAKDPLQMYREPRPPVTIDLVSSADSNGDENDDKSEYEVMRDKNIEENEQVLANLGLQSIPEKNTTADDNSDYKPSASDDSDEVM